MPLHPRISVNGASSLRWSLTEDLGLWTRLGVRKVGLPLSKVSRAELAVGLLLDAGIQVDSLVLGSAFTLWDESCWPAERDRVVGAFSVARALNAGCLYLTTGPSRSGMTADESIDAFCAAVAPTVLEAHAAGVILAVEQNSSLTHDVGCIHTFSDLVHVADATGIGIVADLQNCWLEYRIGRLLAEEAHRIALVQVSDFLVGTEQRLSRVPLGDGDMPLEILLSSTLRGGYEGAFDIEVLGPHIETVGYEVAIGRSVEWLTGCLSRLGL